METVKLIRLVRKGSTNSRWEGQKTDGSLVTFLIPNASNYQIGQDYLLDSAGATPAGQRTSAPKAGEAPKVKAPANEVEQNIANAQPVHIDEADIVL